MLIPENYFFMCSFEVTRTVSSHLLQLMSSSSNHSLTQRQTVTVFSLSPVSQLSFQHGDARPINTQIKSSLQWSRPTSAASSLFLSFSDY